VKLRHFYLAVATLGLLLPNAAFFGWVAAHGLDGSRFLRDLFANGVSAFFGLDVVVSALAVTGFIAVEARRLGLRRPWVPITAVCIVGVSFGLPLFLYQRQRRLDNTVGNAGR